MLKRFLAYYKPHKTLFILDMLASLAVALVGVVYPIVTRSMLNDLIPNKKWELIIFFGMLLLGLYFVRMLLNFFIQYKGHLMGIRMQAQMRSDLFAHLEKLPFSFFDANETGKIMSRMTSDLQEITELAHHGPENLIICSISIVISFTYLTTINWKLSLIVFACVPLLILVSAITRQKMRKAFQRRREAMATINGALQSSIAGIRVTKAFTNANMEQDKFEIGNKDFIDSSMDSYHAMATFHSSTSFITDIFNVVILIAGGIFLYAGEINFADYSAFIVSISLFLNPVNTLIRFMEQYQNGVAGFERFIAIMDTKPEEDDENAEDAGILSGRIEFRNVVSGYDDGPDVLHGIDLTVDKGKTFALVGPSGGGKTTICHLIPNFYEIREGSILLDGKDLTRLTRQSVRKNIGIVQQDVYLFNASIRDNILYGKPDATEEEVLEAAKRANIHDFVTSLENGYDTVIGERGVRLSGGQKQRLCIARVFLKNPPILILDEATSALDNTTEILIQRALDELCKGRTTLVVAHRLSTIKNADEIAVISGGKITEQGNHEDLLTLGGTYKRLYEQQFRDDVEIIAEEY
ncbi:MAG: ABC transporter ATP-binding protein [Ruminococcaceae bacterium]|nr:ABC transporter ATP-binding protein [Oscillospiraceae bacterium]